MHQKSGSKALLQMGAAVSANEHDDEGMVSSFIGAQLRPPSALLRMTFVTDARERPERSVLS